MVCCVLYSLSLRTGGQFQFKVIFSGHNFCKEIAQTPDKDAPFQCACVERLCLCMLSCSVLIIHVKTEVYFGFTCLTIRICSAFPSMLSYTLGLCVWLYAKAMHLRQNCSILWDLAFSCTHMLSVCVIIRVWAYAFGFMYMLSNSVKTELYSGLMHLAVRKR